MNKALSSFGAPAPVKALANTAITTSAQAQAAQKKIADAKAAADKAATALKAKAAGTVNNAINSFTNPFGKK
jgi:hypothetical protein